MSEQQLNNNITLFNKKLRVASSFISFIQYDPNSGVLRVWIGNKEYDYPGVSKQEFISFYSSSSKGRYFDVHIKLKKARL